MSISIDELYGLGENARLAEHSAVEAGKVGGLRGGSTGAMLYGKTPVGQCARKAYLRFKGVDLHDIEENRHLMFDAGLRNEDSWTETLARGIKESGSDLVIKREDEIGITWELENGTRVTGRPDICLGLLNGTGKFEAKLGLELKLVCAIWTAKDLIVYAEPKLPHLLQAGHYLKQMSLGNYLDGKPSPDLEWEIWYTSRTDFAISGEAWMRNLFAKAPAHYMEWREDAKTGRPYPLKVLPFRMGFKIKYSPQGQLLFQRIPTKEHPLEAGAAWERSVVTWSGINQFFDMVSQVDESGELPPRPVNVSALGEKGSYSMCSSLYCPMSKNCDKHEDNLAAWLESAKEVSEANR